MTSEIIKAAQDYLTVATKENGKKKIMDIGTLLKKHPSEDVMNLLKTMIKEKHQALRDLILEDKTRPEIDEVVATIFIITMALKSIEGEKEVSTCGRAKQGTRGGG